MSSGVSNCASGEFRPNVNDDDDDVGDSGDLSDGAGTSDE